MTMSERPAAAEESPAATEAPGVANETSPQAESTPLDAGQVEAKPKSARGRRSREQTPRDDNPATSAEALAKAAALAKEIAPRVEAILLSVDRAVARDRVAVAMGLIPDDAHVGDEQVLRPPVDVRAREEAMLAVDAAVTNLNQAYEETGRSFRIAALAGGYRITTLPTFAPVIAAFHKQRLSSKLSRPAVETLAIIAYRQPITRAELESIRGVSCGEVLRGLMDRRLVTSKGRAEELGRPLLYGTTKQFLDQFGLATLADLPKPAELKLG